MDDRCRHWIHLAQYDFDTAKVMLEGRRYLCVGFMCHQVIEKALKAYFVYLPNQTPPYTHNLTLISKESGLYSKQ